MVKVITMKNNNEKIITKTNHKVMIKINRIHEALNEREVTLMNSLLKKIAEHDNKNN